MIEIDIAEIYDNSLRARLQAFEDVRGKYLDYYGGDPDTQFAYYLEDEIEKLKEVLNGDPQSEYPG